MSVRRNELTRRIARAGLALYAVFSALLPLADAELHAGAIQNASTVRQTQESAVAADLPGCALCAAMHIAADVPAAVPSLHVEAITYATIDARSHQIAYRTLPTTARPRAPPVA